MVKEGDLLAVFNSAHRVMKAESVLKELGLPILLIPAPRFLKTDCGLAIRFRGDESERIMKILEQEQLLPEFVSGYSQGEYKTLWQTSDPVTSLHYIGAFHENN
jgi:hypothetical protein